MNALKARRSLVSIALLTSALGLSMCGGKVVLDGEFGAGTGDGGAGGVSTSAHVSVGAGLTCTEETCSGLGTTECGCVRKCDSAVLEVKCAPNENKTLQCICSYEDVFSGACFETEVALSCNMDKGCCSKYFLGK